MRWLAHFVEVDAESLYEAVALANAGPAVSWTNNSVTGEWRRKRRTTSRN